MVLGPVRTDEFACLRRTGHGRIMYCPEFRRVVMDFKGVWFVFRLWEFERLQRHFSSMVSCPFSRRRLESGEEIRIGDASGRNSLILALDELDELAELMDAAALLLGAEGAENERTLP